MSEKMKNVNKANLETFASCLKTNFETKTLNINKGDNTLQSTIKPGNINNLTYLDISGNVNFSTLTSSAYASRVSDSVSDGTRYDSSTDTLIKRPLWISAGTHRNNISGGLVKGVPNLSNPSELYFIADGASTGQGHLFAKRLRSNHIVADDFTSSGLFYMMVDSSNELNFKSSIGGNLHINYKGYEGVTPFNTICFNDGTSKGDSYSQLKFKINELTDNTNAPICLYAGNSVFKAPSSKLTLNPSDGSLNVGTKVTSPLFVGNLSGNADTATKLSSSKKITVSDSLGILPSFSISTDFEANEITISGGSEHYSLCHTILCITEYISEISGKPRADLIIDVYTYKSIKNSYTGAGNYIVVSDSGSLHYCLRQLMSSDLGTGYFVLRGQVNNKPIHCVWQGNGATNWKGWGNTGCTGYNIAPYTPDGSNLEGFSLTCLDGTSFLLQGYDNSCSMKIFKADICYGDAGYSHIRS